MFRIAQNGFIFPLKWTLDKTYVNTDKIVFHSIYEYVLREMTKVICVSISFKYRTSVYKFIWNIIQFTTLWTVPINRTPTIVFNVCVFENGNRIKQQQNFWNTFLFRIILSFNINCKQFFLICNSSKLLEVSLIKMIFMQGVSTKTVLN